MLKQLCAALLLLWMAPAFAITQYVNQSCPNNGDGTLQTCGAAAGPGAFNVATSLTLASNNVAYFCGTVSTLFTPGGVSFTAGRQILSGACPGNPAVVTASFISFGGVARSHLQVEDFTVTGGAIAVKLGGAAAGQTDVIVRRINCLNVTTACVQVDPAADTSVVAPEIYQITCTSMGIGGADDGTPTGTPGDGIGDHPLGYCVGVLGIAKGAGTAPGLTTSPLVHDINCFPDKLIGRYCVNFYPPDNLATGGQVRTGKIYSVFSKGHSRFPVVNLTNDVDDTDITGITCEGTVGGAIIHTGGQGSFSTPAVAFTDRTVVHDNKLNCRAVITQDNPADAAGLYPDGGSEAGIWERNSTHGNSVAGIYFYYANSHIFRNNVTWDNGDNALNLHGVSGANTFYGNVLIGSSKSAASGTAAQGRDVVQVDATVPTTNVFRGNIVLGDSGVPKCFDADATVTTSHNDINGCAIRAEGFTPAATDLNLVPKFLGVGVANTPEYFKLSPTSPLRYAGFCYFSTGCAALDFEKNRTRNPPHMGAFQN